MLLKRFYDDGLAQASYMIGCGNECLIIDPNRDFDQYLNAAKQKHCKIIAVTETHIHADYLSGARELAKTAGANLYISDEGGKDWRYAFRTEPNVVLLKNKSQFHIGNVRLDVIHTPGHTPEHIVFKVTDESTSRKPLGLIGGDFLFIGDVGRPDLLETAAGIKNTREPSAKKLFASLKRI